jgi:hypothetical protein
MELTEGALTHANTACMAVLQTLCRATFILAEIIREIAVDDVEFQEGPGPGRQLRLFQQTVRARRGTELMISDRESFCAFPGRDETRP